MVTAHISLAPGCLQVGGSATLIGARVLIETGKALAAKELEAAAVDIEFAEGRYRIAGTDRSIGLAELAGKQPERRIAITHSETVKGQTWPNGCQVCEAEVDPDTGVVRLVRLVAVDDLCVMSEQVAKSSLLRASVRLRNVASRGVFIFL